MRPTDKCCKQDWPRGQGNFRLLVTCSMQASPVPSYFAQPPCLCRRGTLFNTLARCLGQVSAPARGLFGKDIQRTRIGPRRRTPTR
jgi:hypothetical protein